MMLALTCGQQSMHNRMGRRRTQYKVYLPLYAVADECRQPPFGESPYALLPNRDLVEKQAMPLRHKAQHR